MIKKKTHLILLVMNFWIDSSEMAQLLPISNFRKWSNKGRSLTWVFARINMPIFFAIKLYISGVLLQARSSKLNSYISQQCFFSYRSGTSFNFKSNMPTCSWFGGVAITYVLRKQAEWVPYSFIVSIFQFQYQYHYTLPII